MERALGQFMLDLHTNEHGYLEVQPPLLVKRRIRHAANSEDANQSARGSLLET